MSLDRHSAKKARQLRGLKATNAALEARRIMAAKDDYSERPKKSAIDIEAVRREIMDIVTYQDRECRDLHEQRLTNKRFIELVNQCCKHPHGDLILWEAQKACDIAQRHDLRRILDRAMERHFPDPEPQVTDPHIEQEPDKAAIESDEKQIPKRSPDNNLRIGFWQKLFGGPQRTKMPQATKPHEKPLAIQPSSEKVLGGCRLVKKIGEGGFGAVYKAHHLALNIPVAVKVLVSRRPGGDAPVEERFLREARIVARLKHPNIVGVLNVGSEDGIHFIVMDFVEGCSLQVLLKEKGRLPVPSAVVVFSQICQGLHYAHEQGVMHRDIKPGNILIETSGVPKIADFGFAKFADDDLSLTVSGAVMGTPYYLSPEQARDAKNVDRRSDIYSLGCTLYHVVCGRVPFQGETVAQVLLAHQQAPVPDPHSVDSAIPRDLAQIIMKMMAKKPADRFESAGAVHKQLAAFVSNIGHRN
jgi:serine/threonine-protein kinase